LKGSEAVIRKATAQADPGQQDGTDEPFPIIIALQSSQIDSGGKALVAKQF
jgi:hypothetical protein